MNYLMQRRFLQQNFYQGMNNSRIKQELSDDLKSFSSLLNFAIKNHPDLLRKKRFGVILVSHFLNFHGILDTPKGKRVRVHDNG